MEPQAQGTKGGNTMAYIATKPCRLAGQSFKIGEIVPAEVIQPGAAKNLVKMGVIAEEGYELISASVDTIAAPVTGPKVIIHAEEGDLVLELTNDGLQSVFDVLTAKANATEPIISKMTDQDALILLNISDSRKSVREMTEARVNELAGGEESEGDA